MGATQDLDQPDFAAATSGLWDNRSNYDASGNVYPSTGGSGTSGAILKSDQWRISVAGTLGGTAVSIGDVLVALVDTPGSTSSNWMVLQGNVVAFTGDSGSGGVEGLVPAPAAGDAAAGKFLKANGSWVAVSSSNLGSADLTSSANARQFILNGTASTNYLDITNGTDEIIRFRGDKQIVIGDSGGQPGIKFDPYATTSWAMLQYLAAGSSYAWNVYNSSGQELFRFDSAGLIYAVRPAGIASHMNYNSFINFHAAGTTSSLGFVQTNGSADTIYIGHSGGHGYVDIKNSTAVTKTSLAGSGDSYFINSLAVGASAANASAIFDITSTTKGLGLPSMTTTQKNAVSSPRAGLMVYDSTLNQASYYNGSTWVNI